MAGDNPLADSSTKKVRFKESVTNLKDVMVVPADSSTKKVHFKESVTNPKDVMVVDLAPTLTLSWKDLVLGKGSLEQNGVSGVEFSFLKWDVKKLVVNGIPSILNSQKEYINFLSRKCPLQWFSIC
ncbi:hypothetical protein PVK06_049240 [Gossypium arboreum]|uniref:Uncharacterized protein n=1 Tax=Gossypium arboreum TaxID=29729 RepID=A0ABR0MIK9_GOSAR|nr:hypothetical protein PVK06_049240 [Gossypium arboreum]